MKLKGEFYMKFEKREHWKRFLFPKSLVRLFSGKKKLKPLSRKKMQVLLMDDFYQEKEG